VNITFRLETPADRYAVEAMTREAFWQFWEDGRKICDEHLLVHKLRTAQGFVPELNYVAEVDGELVGHIIFTKSRIEGEDGKETETLTFGPLTVLPEMQSKGIGKALMRHTFAEAKRLGYRAVLIFGHPDYYPRAGFRRAAEFGVTTADGKTFDAFMAYPLYDGALDGIRGRYFIDPVYEQLSQEEALAFDTKFPPKTPHSPVPLKTLLERLEPGAAKAIQGLGIPNLDILKSRSERDISSLEGMDEKAVETVRAVMREHGYRWGG
jgi:predicted N-acetyltransferase YhbS